MKVYIVMRHVLRDFDYVDAVFDDEEKANDYILNHEENEYYWLELVEHDVC